MKLVALIYIYIYKRKKEKKKKIYLLNTACSKTYKKNKKKYCNPFPGFLFKHKGFDWPAGHKRL